MKNSTITLLFLLVGLSVQAQITFTSDSTFTSTDTSWVQLDTINVSGKTWYQVSQVQFDRSGNRVVTSYAPMPKVRMREYAKQGRDQARQAKKQKQSDIDSLKAQEEVFIAILNALKE